MMLSFFVYYFVTAVMNVFISAVKSHQKIQEERKEIINLEGFYL